LGWGFFDKDGATYFQTPDGIHAPGKHDGNIRECAFFFPEFSLFSTGGTDEASGPLKPFQIGGTGGSSGIFSQNLGKLKENSPVDSTPFAHFNIGGAKGIACSHYFAWFTSKMFRSLGKMSPLT
jgi:hypothetical protein